MFKKLIILLIIFTACCLSAIFWYVSPILHTLPKPTGAYGIGTVSQYAIQNGQEFNVQFWYPTDKAKSCSYAYGNPALNAHAIQSITSNLPFMPAFLFSRALNLCSYAEPNGALSVAQQEYPVIIFLPGYGSSCSYYSALLEDLASTGFIVCGINSPSINVVFLPNGRIMDSDPRVFSEVDGVRKGVDGVMANVKFVVDELIKNNNDMNSMWYQHIDSTKLIIVGHSFGGSAAIEVARNDHRFAAGINLDGWLEMRTTNKIDIPFLFLLNDSLFPPGKQEGMQEINETCQKSNACMIKVIPGAGHSSFHDFAFLKWPFSAWILDPGRGDPYEIFAYIKGAIKSHIAQIFYPTLLRYQLFMDPAIGFTVHPIGSNCLVFASGTKIQSLNRVINNAVPKKSDVESVKAFFGEVPFMWVVNSRDDESQKILEENGLHSVGSFPTMTTGLGAIGASKYGDGVSLKSIAMHGPELEEWIRIVAQVFHMEQAELVKVMDMFRDQINPDSYSLYLGLFNGQVAAVGMGIWHKGIASLHWIGTLPEFRKKGLGNAIVHQILLDAQKKGCKEAILMSSSQAKSVYERQGFSEYCSYTIFMGGN